jgi:hypothetical protein
LKEIKEEIENCLEYLVDVEYSVQDNDIIFTWEYSNDIGCMISISDKGQVFASVGKDYPGDGEAFDNDDYQLFEDHSVFIKEWEDFFSGNFTDLIHQMKDFAK